jgi:hypothetical protein
MRKSEEESIRKKLRAGAVGHGMAAGRPVVAISADGKALALITPGHEYLWETAKVPEIIAGLREHAEGPSMPSAGGLVCSVTGDCVALSDEPAKQSFKNINGQARLLVNVNRSFTFPRKETAKVADLLEEALRPNNSGDEH